MDMMAMPRLSNKTHLALSHGSLVVLIMLLLGACEKKVESEAVRPVRSLVVQAHLSGEPIALTGQLHARDETKLAFRLSGKLIERSVTVGDTVKAGQIVARLDAATERHARNAARADYTAALAVLDQTAAAERRFGTLLKESAVSKAEYEETVRHLKTAHAQVDATRAKLDTAEIQLGYAELKADADGVITVKGAEPGEVIQAGQMIFSLAHQKGRDAVFDMPAQIIRAGMSAQQAVDVWLADNPDIKTIGHVREIAPQADASTRTYQVKVSLDSLPSGMFLGSTVVGRLRLQMATLIEVPFSALMMSATQPAVWVIDPQTAVVHKREVVVARYNQQAVVVASGLLSGDRIVTAGAQSLHDGQKVALLEGESGGR
ncbi:MAG: efflux RND transporter periplasmic adaptor subunit [Nitrospira sp.]|nr:MAG: efflux RND transporter periplasmic adaptor subunit [Nitrospira sp.]